MERQNNKAKLAFEMLEKEMERVLSQEMEELKGGTGPGDCVFQSLSFLTGLSISQLESAYASYFNNFYGVTYMSGDVADTLGVSGNLLSGFLSQYGMSAGYSTHGTPYGYCSSGSMGIITLLNASGGHAVNITGMADADTYYYYDAQNQTTGTICTNDPNIIGIYSKP